MRENLIGYLLKSLDPSECEIVEEQLGKDPALRRDLELLDIGLEPLRADQGHFDPPPGLAERTCQQVLGQARVASAARSMPQQVAYATAPPRPRWTLADMLVAAAIFLAASALLFPAVSHSRYTARLASCANNLRQIGLAMSEYSMRHDGYFPDVAPQGHRAVAGVYAPKLVHGGLLPDARQLICPASALADDSSKFRVPTLDELDKADGAELASMQRNMGGSYGYNLGHIAGGRYQPTKNQHRGTFAIMSDAPSVELPEHQSPNHGGRGQNVLFEDGHVNYLSTCNAQDCRDNIFVNDRGEVAAGVHPDDAVIGPSSAHPVPVSFVAEE